MGVCDSDNNFPHINKGPGIFHKQTFGDPLRDGYKFGFNGENNFTAGKGGLTFIFYNFKIKYCISHSPTKESFYITEITIGNKTHPPIITKGRHPDYSELYDINNLKNPYMGFDGYMHCASCRRRYEQGHRCETAYL